MARLRLKPWSGASIAEEARDELVLIALKQIAGGDKFAYQWCGDALILAIKDSEGVDVWDMTVRRHGTKKI